MVGKAHRPSQGFWETAAGVACAFHVTAAKVEKLFGPGARGLLDDRTENNWFERETTLFRTPLF